MKIRTLIAVDREDFQTNILNLISSGEYKEILSNMAHSNIESEQGFIQGMIWATLYSVQCKTYVGDIDEDKTGE